MVDKQMHRYFPFLHQQDTCLFNLARELAATMADAECTYSIVDMSKKCSLPEKGEDSAEATGYGTVLCGG